MCGQPHQKNPETKQRLKPGDPDVRSARRGVFWRRKNSSRELAVRSSALGRDCLEYTAREIFLVAQCAHNRMTDDDTHGKGFDCGALPGVRRINDHGATELFVELCDTDG